MGADSKIAWTHHTFNPLWGCTKISPGCRNCYAETQSSRFGFGVWGPTAERRTFGEKHWREPLKWNREAEKEGVRKRVFCASMCDIFEDHPTVDQERAKLWPLIRATPWLDWQLLTKRADRIADNLPADWGTGYPNVWLGVSVEDAGYVWRVSCLRAIPAVVRFVSYEPALGPIAHAVSLRNIDWLIYGGESGPGHRPEDKQWARDVRALCAATGTAFFHKQSAGQYSETGVELDGEVVRAYPTARIPLPMAGDLFAKEA